MIGTRRLPERLFGATKPAVAVPAAFDVDQVVVEVDVVPLERLEFAEPEAGVEGGGVDRAVAEGERVEQARLLGGVRCGRGGRGRRGG